MKCKLFVLTVLAVFPCARSLAVDVRMVNENRVPHINQAQNFADLMNPRGTDLTINNNQLTYMQLPTAGGNNLGQLHVQVDPARIRLQDNRPAQWFVDQNFQMVPYRPFAAGDLTDINGGAFHCSPTSAAMIMQFWATQLNMPALGQGMQETAVQYVDALANAMDTNDQNANINNNDRSGHFGTLLGNVTAAMNNFAQGRVNGIRLRAGDAAAFNADAYRAEINANRPVFISFREAGALIGHSVVGVGYSTNDGMNAPLTGLFIRDPATNNNEDSMRVPNAAQIIPINRNDGFRTNSEGDIYISTSNGSLLEDAVMISMTVVPEPSSVALLLVGLSGLGIASRRARRESVD